MENYKDLMRMEAIWSRTILTALDSVDPVNRTIDTSGVKKGLRNEFEVAYGARSKSPIFVEKIFRKYGRATEEALEIIPKNLEEGLVALAQASRAEGGYFISEYARSIEERDNVPDEVKKRLNAMKKKEGREISLEEIAKLDVYVLIREEQLEKEQEAKKGKKRKRKK